jgi:hypothetical protein
VVTPRRPRVVVARCGYLTALAAMARRLRR